MITRRGFTIGLAGLVAAPAVVKIESLMRLRSTPQLIMPLPFYGRSPVMSILEDIRLMQEQINQSYYTDLYKMLSDQSQGSR